MTVNTTPGTAGQQPPADTILGDVAELNARRTAAAVLGDYKAALASAPVTQPPGREWMLRLASVLEDLLEVLEDQADEDQDGGYVCPETSDGQHCGDWHEGGKCGACGQTGPDPDDDEDLEPYCYTCGATIGIFIGQGDAWLHYTGEGTVASPVELFDAGHAPEVAWRPAGAR